MKQPVFHCESLPSANEAPACDGHMLATRSGVWGRALTCPGSSVGPRARPIRGGQIRSSSRQTEPEAFASPVNPPRSPRSSLFEIRSLPDQPARRRVTAGLAAAVAALEFD